MLETIHKDRAYNKIIIYVDTNNGPMFFPGANGFSVYTEFTVVLLMANVKVYGRCMQTVEQQYVLAQHLP